MQLRKLVLYSAAALALLACSRADYKDSVTPTSVIEPTAAVELNVNQTYETNPVQQEIKYGILSGKRICIDPGHDKTYVPGATGRAGGREFYEHILTLEVGYRLKSLLEQDGADVCVTRKEDGTLQLPTVDEDGDGKISPPKETSQPRIDYVNQFGAELLLSVHFNGYDNPNVSGTEVYYSDTGAREAENKRFAKSILDSLVEGIRESGYNTVNKGPKSDLYQRYADRPAERLYTLGNNPNSFRTGNYVGSLAEVLFLSSPQDVSFLQRGDALDVIANTLYNGIKNYYESAPSETRSNAPAEVVRGNRAYPRIALTFDCGPWVDRNYITRILDALQGRRVTFFVTGEFIRKNPDIFQRIAENHELANHSNTHPDFALLSDIERRNEMRRTEEMVNSLGYTTKPLWRAPFGSRNREVLSTAIEEGYPLHIFWTRDSGDWTNASSEEVKNNVFRNVGNGDVIVQHCNSWQTAEILPQIIKGLEDMGLEITTVSMVLPN